MDETHRLLFHHHILMSYALVFIVFLTVLATGAVTWVAWMTRTWSAELDRRFEQSKRDSERLGYYLFTKLGPADTK